MYWAAPLMQVDLGQNILISCWSGIDESSHIRWYSLMFDKDRTTARMLVDSKSSSHKRSEALESG